jgi:CspA family cold shock protein
VNVTGHVVSNSAWRHNRVAGILLSMAQGAVKFFKADKGYGAIMSAELPEGYDAWVHFSVIQMDGYRYLHAGDLVEFDYEPAQQDSFRFVATRVRKL